MQYLNYNIERLRQNAPELAEAVRHSVGGVLTIVPSREGSPSATHEGQWVHSAYDPKKEAGS